MPLDPYNINFEQENFEDKDNPENTAKLEVIAARNDVINTTIRNMLSSAVDKDYVTKAREYAKKFKVIGIDDWLTDGRTIFKSQEKLEEWASKLPWPHMNNYYK